MAIERICINIDERNDFISLLKIIKELNIMSSMMQ